MRPLATILGALAFLWASGTTVYVLLASSESGMSGSDMLATSADGVAGMPPSLATANGVWMTALLMGVTLAASLPVGIALRYPARQRSAAWGTGLVILGFCLVSGLFLGLLYLPSAILLMAAGAAAGAEPPLAPPRIIFRPRV